MPVVEGMREADVDINGQRLTFAEAMCLRVAVSTFRMMLAERGYRAGIGPRLAAGYDEHLRQVEQTLLGEPQRCGAGSLGIVCTREAGHPGDHRGTFDWRVE